MNHPTNNMPSSFAAIGEDDCSPQNTAIPTRIVNRSPSESKGLCLNEGSIELSSNGVPVSLEETVPVQTPTQFCQSAATQPENNFVPAFTEHHRVMVGDGVSVEPSTQPAFTSTFHIFSTTPLHHHPIETASSTPSAHPLLSPSTGDYFWRYPPSEQGDRSFFTPTPVLIRGEALAGESCSSSTKSTSLTTAPGFSSSLPFSPFPHTSVPTGQYKLPISVGNSSVSHTGPLTDDFENIRRADPPPLSPVNVESFSSPKLLTPVLLDEPARVCTNATTQSQLSMGGGGEETVVGCPAISSVASPPALQSNTNLFVRHIPPWMDDTALEALFSRYGEVVSASVMRDIHTAQSLGRGFVRFRTHESALEAKEAMNNAVVIEQGESDENSGVEPGERLPIEGGVSSKPPLSVQWANAKHDNSVSGIEKNRIHKLFVRNIPMNVTKEMLRAIFAPFGKITEISLHDDTAAAEHTLHSLSSPQPRQETRRIAFVTFAGDGEAAAAARVVHNTRPFKSCGGVALMVKLAEDTPTHPSKRMPSHSSTTLSLQSSSIRSHSNAGPSFLSIPPPPTGHQASSSTHIMNVSHASHANHQYIQSHQNSNSITTTYHQPSPVFVTPSNLSPCCTIDTVARHTTDVSIDADNTSRYVQGGHSVKGPPMIAPISAMSPLSWQTNGGTRGTGGTVGFLTPNSGHHHNNNSSVDIAGGSGAQLSSMSSIGSTSTPHGLQTQNTLNFSASYAGASTASGGGHVFISSNPPNSDGGGTPAQAQCLIPAYSAPAPAPRSVSYTSCPPPPPPGSAGPWLKEMHCYSMTNPTGANDRFSEASAFCPIPSPLSPPENSMGLLQTKTLGSGRFSSRTGSPPHVGGTRRGSEQEGGGWVPRRSSGFSVNTLPQATLSPSIVPATSLSINTTVPSNSYTFLGGGAGVSPHISQHSAFMPPQPHASKSMVSMLSSTSRGMTASSVHQRLTCGSEPSTPGGPPPQAFPGGLTNSAPGYYLSLQMTPLVTTSTASWSFTNNNNTHNNINNSVCISVGAVPESEEIPSTPGSVLTTMSTSVTAPPPRISSNGVLYPVASAFTSLPRFSSVDTPTASHVDPSATPPPRI